MSEKEASGPDFWGAVEGDEALRRYRTLVNTVNDGIYQLDADGRFVAVNDVICEMTGYGREELLGEYVSILIDDDDIELIAREIQRRYVDGEAEHETFEFTVRRADGASIVCELQLSLLVEDGSFQGSVGIVRDITDRKRTERRLREREQQFQRERDLTTQVLDASPVGIMVLDADGAVTRINERGRDLLDIADADSFTPSDRPTYDEDGTPLAADERPWAETLASGDPVFERILQIELPDDDGRWLSVNSTPVGTDGGDIDRVITTFEDITDIKRRERRLEHRTDELTTERDEIYSRISDGVMALNEAWEFTHVNEQAAEILDRDEAQLLGTSVWDAFPELRDTTFEEGCREAMATQEPVSFEAYYPPHDAWYEEHVYPSETGLSIYFRDVTERKRLETELEEIYGRISDAFFALDEEWRFTYLNDRAHELINPDGRTLVGKHVWEEFPAAVERAFEPKYERAMYDQETVSFEEYYPEPLDVWVEVRAYPSETGLSVYFRDITERKERERALERSERRYRTLAEHFPGGVVGVYDERLRFTLIEGAALDDLGVDAADVEGKTVEELFPPETASDVAPLFEGAIDDGETDSTTTAFAGRHWQVWATPLQDADGEIFAGLSFAQDITDQVEYERRLEELIDRLEESNERLEQFAYAASHDLQEPLRMVSSYLQLLENRYKDALDEDGREFIEFAVDGADRMREMVDGLLQYSRVDTRGDHFERVGLEEVFADVRDNLQVKIGEHDAEITADDLPHVEGDRGQLRQVFQNLLDNAIEYSGDEPPRVRVSAERDGDEWAISVSDEGTGIDPEDADRIFEVFQRLHSQDDHDGAGIGLALVERIVERHGGDIGVDSRPGEGATFSFTLPAAGDGDA